MTPLLKILHAYRSTSQTEREKGNYFEELIRTFFRYEASYADLYSDVWLYSDWAKETGTPEFGLSAKDTGIDLVAKTQGTEEYHAIQCKCYAEDHRVRKADIDSFFTASGQKPFTQRIVVITTNHWSDNAENSLNNQQPPVYKIDLLDLENSQIDWAKYKPAKKPVLKPKYDIDAPRSRHQKAALTNTLLGFKSADRGKLIMACGTGKTFTSLKIAEKYAGKPALEWVMERQAVTTDKKSGIENDANLWATETIGNAKYPLELFLRVITVSLETNRIVAGLPELEISVESPA
jgi:predicted helicase